jgi:hypothetical protein
MVRFMNKKLETLIDSVPTWPQEAQEEAVRALSAIEEKHIGVRRPVTAEDEAKLAALRETINRSIERGGSFTDEEVEASIAARLDAWERERNGA